MEEGLLGRGVALVVVMMAFEVNATEETSAVGGRRTQVGEGGMLPPKHTLWPPRCRFSKPHTHSHLHVLAPHPHPHPTLPYPTLPYPTLLYPPSTPAEPRVRRTAANVPRGFV